MKRTIRRDPEPKTVVVIPLPSGRFGYVCCITYSCWVYNFVTDYPTKCRRYFSPDYWWRPIDVTRFRVDMRDVCTIDLNRDQLITPPTVQVYHGPGKPPRYRILDADPRRRIGNEIYKEISPEAATKFHRYELFDAPNLAPFIANHEPELRLIRVPAEERAPELVREPPKDDIDRADREPKLIEVNFSGTEGMKVRDPAEIEERLADELAKHECGEITGGGALTGGPVGSGTPLDVFDFAIEAEPGQATKAIRCIQRVLTRLKAPATTEILEHHFQQEDPISHPLQPPKRKAGRTSDPSA